ncbi:hypothetical protein NA56DRAFT_731507 [Hyaloscypha hepaticicola]|uniref:Heterokaryon incompatibility domain-containing protein n=1 Tax=Hyaloscypha hepaticicola TaxID=2082293 RepID=A0A2J6PQE8_9HELO|nr:hypothetical protein NA56DRAFT_731507 [Hyaloscypha hepaticicola]
MPYYHLSVSEVYREFALRCLHDDPDLFILSTVEDHSLRRVELPSWAPDLSIPLARSMLAYPSMDVMVPYLESAKGKPTMTWSGTEPDVLILQGHRVDVIQNVLDTGASALVQGIVHLTKAFAQDFPLEYPTGETKTEALWRTLMANIGNTPTYEYPAPEVFAKFFAADSNKEAVISEEGLRGLQIEDNSGGPGSYSGDQASQDSKDFTEAVSRAMGERKFFVTEGKLYGIGPQSVQKGDIVFLIAGGRVSYAIRPHETNGSMEFSFVGECYCHGICHGQALSK